MNESRRDRKRWGSPATIVMDTGDEDPSLACTDAVSGKVVVTRNLHIVDSYEEAYLRAMGLDFRSLFVGYCQYSVCLWLVC